MGTITAATAIIHFVGLCVFTTQTRPAWTDLTAKSVPSSAYAREAPTRPIQQTAVPYLVAVLPVVDTSSGIDSHKALIAFRQSQVVLANGWKPSLLRSDVPYDHDHLLFVELTKDQVSFVATGVNGPSLAGFPLTLPSLKKLYTKPGLTPNMNADYTQAASYVQAAAVFDLPVGSLNACMAGQNNTRFDTLLKLNTDCFLLIVSGTKTLVLKALDNDDTVLVENLPWGYAAGDPKYAPSPTPHYHVYCDMVGVDGNTCTSTGFPKATDHGLASSTNSTAPITQCKYNAMNAPLERGRVTVGARGSKGPPPGTAAASFECSNTQWP
ncbi:MAG TPA: hypothetical protein VEZ11_03920 [Thermoanaerobaculia bacterium]|nr:hypothetical protein [Thermoanaerobaculia bacterium]